MQRFVRKYYAATLLSARMFGGSDGLAEVMAEINGSSMSGDTELGKLKQLRTGPLQLYVRKSFMSNAYTSIKLKEFISVVVKPCLQVNVSAVPEHMADVMARFTAIVRGGEASEQDACNLKMAASCLSGELESHPLIQGLVLQCHRMLHKKTLGVGMQGPRQDCTELEHSLISDAGMSLAMATGNSVLAREFGLSSALCRISLDELDKNALPNSALALLWPEQLKENFVIADQRFVRPENTPKRHLLNKMNFFVVFNAFCILWSSVFPFCSFFLQTQFRFYCLVMK